MNTREEVWVRTICSVISSVHVFTDRNGDKIPQSTIADAVLADFDKRFPKEAEKPIVDHFGKGQPR